MVAISMDREEEVAEVKRHALGELVAPAYEPSFEKVEGVLEFGAALRSGLHHLCPYKRAETVAAQLRVVGVAHVVAEIQYGTVTSNGIVG